MVPLRDQHSTGNCWFEKDSTEEER